MVMLYSIIQDKSFIPKNRGMSHERYRKELEHLKWSSAVLTVKEFMEAHGNKLPKIITISSGFCGLDNMHTYSSGEIYFVYGIRHQKRFVLTEVDSHRSISIPADSVIKFIVEEGKLDAPTPMVIKDIVEQHRWSQNTLTLSPERPLGVQDVYTKVTPTVLGQLTLDISNCYEERYLITLSLLPTGPLQSPVAIPVYVPIEVHVATMKKDVAFATELMGCARLCAVSKMEFNQDAMVYNKSFPSSQYERMLPQGFICSPLVDGSNYFTKFINKGNSPQEAASPWSTMQQKPKDLKWTSAQEVQKTQTAVNKCSSEPPSSVKGDSPISTLSHKYESLPGLLTRQPPIIPVSFSTTSRPSSVTTAKQPAVTAELLSKICKWRVKAEGDDTEQGTDSTVLPTMTRSLSHCPEPSGLRSSSNASEEEFNPFKRRSSEPVSFKNKTMSVSPAESHNGVTCISIQDGQYSVIMQDQAFESQSLGWSVLPNQLDKSRIRDQIFLSTLPSSNNEKPLIPNFRSVHSSVTRAPKNDFVPEPTLGRRPSSSKLPQHLSVAEVVQLAQEIRLSAVSVAKIDSEKIDGSLLKDLVQKGVVQQVLALSQLEALKLEKAVKEGWRPKEN